MVKNKDKSKKNIYEDVSGVAIYEDVEDALEEKPNVESNTQVKYNDAVF